MGGSAGEGCAGHGRVWDFVAVRGVTADGVAAGRCAAGGCTAGSSAGEGRVLMHRNDFAMIDIVTIVILIDHVIATTNSTTSCILN